MITRNVENETEIICFDDSQVDELNHEIKKNKGDITIDMNLSQVQKNENIERKSAIRLEPGLCIPCCCLCCRNPFWPIPCPCLPCIPCTII